MSEQLCRPPTPDPLRAKLEEAGFPLTCLKGLMSAHRVNECNYWVKFKELFSQIWMNIFLPLLTTQVQTSPCTKRVHNREVTVWLINIYFQLSHWLEAPQQKQFWQCLCFVMFVDTCHRSQSGFGKHHSPSYTNIFNHSTTLHPINPLRRQG